MISKEDFISMVEDYMEKAGEWLGDLGISPTREIEKGTAPGFLKLFKAQEKRNYNLYMKLLKAAGESISDEDGVFDVIDKITCFEDDFDFDFLELLADYCVLNPNYGDGIINEINNANLRTAIRHYFNTNIMGNEDIILFKAAFPNSDGEDFLNFFKNWKKDKYEDFMNDCKDRGLVISSSDGIFDIFEKMMLCRRNLLINPDLFDYFSYFCTLNPSYGDKVSKIVA